MGYLQSLDAEAPRFPGPHCLLCDVKLPKIDGLELLRRLKGRYDIPIILMSGASGASEAVSAFHHGALDFLIKPIEIEILLDSLGMDRWVMGQYCYWRVRLRPRSAPYYG